MLNKIFLMGRLTRDPEMRHTQNGTAVASFSIAVDRDFKDTAPYTVLQRMDLEFYKNEYVLERREDV